MDNLFHLKVCFLNRILYILDLYQIIDNGVDGESRWRMNLKFVGYIAPVSRNGMDREKEGVGYFFIGHAFGYTSYDFLFSLA